MPGKGTIVGYTIPLLYIRKRKNQITIGYIAEEAGFEPAKNIPVYPTNMSFPDCHSSAFGRSATPPFSFILLS